MTVFVVVVLRVVCIIYVVVVVMVRERVVEVVEKRGDALQVRIGIGSMCVCVIVCKSVVLGKSLDGLRSSNILFDDNFLSLYSFFLI